MVMRLGMKMALVTAMFLQMAIAIDHRVGSPSGSWDQLTDFQSWVNSQNFTVGDNLIFEYSAIHDVMEVSKSDYESCTSSNAIDTDAKGKTLIPLKAAGKRYFICSVPGHCDMGMKLQVDVVATSPSPKLQTSPSSSPSLSESVGSPAVSSPLSPSPNQGSDYQPAEAPVGTSIAFAASPSPASEGSYQKYQPLVGMVLAVALLIVVHAF